MPPPRAMSTRNNRLAATPRGAAATTQPKRDFGKYVRRKCCSTVPATYTVRKQLNLILRDSLIGVYWDSSQTLLSILSCAVFVSTSYNEFESQELDLTLAIVFTFDFFLRWYATSDRLYYPFGFFAAVDILACLPVYLELAIGTSVGALGFFRFVRVLRVLRVLRLFKALNANIGAVERKLIVLVLTVLSMVFLTAGLMVILEYDLWEMQMGTPGYEVTGRITTFGEAVYYLIVTLATVGYGDITPKTPLGKACATIFIPLAIIIIPIQVNDLSALLASRSRYAISYVASPVSPHILVMGDVDNEVTLRELLHELYHPDRLLGATEAESDRITLVMAPREPSEGLRNLMLHPLLEGKLLYIRGNPKVDVDLIRAAASQAQACFFLSNVAALNREDEDRQTAFHAVLLRTHAPQLPTFIHSLGSEAARGLDPEDERLTVIAADEIRARLLARAALVPGFSTFMLNLIRARITNSDVTSGLPVWQEEFAISSGIDPVVGPLPAALNGLAFTDVVTVIHSLTEGAVTPIAVQELDVVRGTRLAEMRLQNLAMRCRAGNLLSAELVRAKCALGADAAAADALVPGQVVLNPGPLYRCRAGQLVYCLSSSKAQALLAYSDALYARPNVAQSLPAQLPKVGRTLEEGYGFPDSYVNNMRTKAMCEVRAHERGRQPLSPVATARRGVEEAGPGASSSLGANAGAGTQLSTPSKEAAERPAGSAVVEATAVPPPSLLIPARHPLMGGGAAGVLAGTANRSSEPMKAGGADPESVGSPHALTKSPIAALAHVPLADLVKKQADLLHDLQVHDVRDLPPLTKGEQPRCLTDHVILVCRMMDAQRIVESLRAGGGSSEEQPEVVLMMRQDEGTEMLMGHSMASHIPRKGALTSAGQLNEVCDSVALLQRFKDLGGVHVVLGSAEDMDSLVRAGLSTAGSLILLTSHVAISMVDGERVDNDLVFKYRDIMRAVRMLPTQPYFYAVVELLSCTDIAMLEIGGAASGATQGGPAASRSDGAPRPPVQSLSRLSKGMLDLSATSTHAAAVWTHADSEGVEGEGTGLDLASPVASPPPGGPGGRFSPNIGPTPANDSKPASALSAVRRAVFSGTLAAAGTTSSAHATAMSMGNTTGAVNRSRRALETHYSWVFLSPLYMAGFAVPADCLHTLLVTALYSPATLPLYSSLMSPWPDGGGQVRMEYVPLHFHGKKYGQLAAHLNQQHGVVLVGLYRCRPAARAQAAIRAELAERAEQEAQQATKPNRERSWSSRSFKDKKSVYTSEIAVDPVQLAPFSYVLTHPPPDTLLYSSEDDGDMAYVLSTGPCTGLHGEAGEAVLSSRQMPA